MSRPGVFRAAAALAGVASLVSLVALSSCSKAPQVDSNQLATDQLTADEGLIATIAPDVATIYVNFTCGTDTTFGLSDSNGNGKKPAWAFMRHPTAPKNQISWVVQHNARPVTIDSIANKPGQPPFPIDVDPNHKGGAPGAAFNATVKPNAGAPGVIVPGFHKDTTYSYSIGVTCKPVTGPDVHVVIDPEMIVRRP